MPEPIEQPAELGPSFPPLEGARETIVDIIEKLTAILIEPDGLQVGRFVKVQGSHGLVLRIEPYGDGLVIGIEEPRPRVNVAGWLKGHLSQVKLTPLEIIVVLDGLPDLKIEVIS
jgi:hypothetical protein